MCQANTKELANKLWQFLDKNCRGMENAKKQSDIADIIGISVREVPKLTSVLTGEFGRPVASTMHRPYGIYIPETREEREEYITQLKSRIKALFRRLKAFSNATPGEIVGQMDLGI